MKGLTETIIGADLERASPEGEFMNSITIFVCGVSLRFSQRVTLQ